MQQEAAIKRETCNETPQVASCNKMLMRAATVVQVLQDFLRVLVPRPR